MEKAGGGLCKQAYVPLRHHAQAKPEGESQVGRDGQAVDSASLFDHQYNCEDQWITVQHFGATDVSKAVRRFGCRRLARTSAEGLRVHRRLVGPSLIRRGCMVWLVRGLLAVL